MRTLLDTHAFLWFSFDDARLSETARRIIADGANEIVVSAATAWEIAIKHALGRLPELPEPPRAYVPSRIARYGFQPLPIDISHALNVAELPSLHRDPFDRLLVSQARTEAIPIVTSDPSIARYDVQVIW